MNIFSKTKIPFLNKALDAYSLRQKAIASNITNSTTVDYKPQKVLFEEELNAAMQVRNITGYQTDSHHLPIGSSPYNEGMPRLELSNPEVSGHGRALASGVNEVDIDNEMAELAKNQIRFKFAARFIADAFRGIQKSIRGQQ